MEEKKGISRRGFLKTAAAVGAALTIQPAINKVKAAEAALGGENALSNKKGGMPHRTLGTGRAAFEVSALGFGEPTTAASTRTRNNVSACCTKPWSAA